MTRTGRVAAIAAAIVGAAAVIGFLAGVLAREGLATASLWAGLFGGAAAVFQAAVGVVAAVNRPLRRRILGILRGAPVSDAIHRPLEENAVVDAVLSQGSRHSGTITVIYGLAGSGKTTLVTRVRLHRRIRRRFREVHVVPLGPDVRSREDINLKVVQVIRAILGANPEEMPQDPAEAGRLLGSLLDARPRRLLVLDDVRSAEQAAPFVVGGRRSARLITTQQRALVGGATEIQVDQMTPDEAVELLTRQLPKPPAAELTTRLAEAAGRWPQLLILARGILSAADEGGEGWLGADEAAENLIAQIRAGGADNELNHNRASIIEAAIARLKRPDGAERLADLRAFTAGQPIPAEIVAALWHVTAEIDPLDASQLIAESYRLSLALRRDGGLVLHEVIRDHMRSQAGEGQLANLDGQLVRGIAALYPEAEALPGDGPGRIAWWQPIEGRMTESATAARYVDENILRHMLAAGEVG